MGFWPLLNPNAISKSTPCRGVPVTHPVLFLRAGLPRLYPGQLLSGTTGRVGSCTGGSAVLGACSVDAVVGVAVLGACSVDAVVCVAVLGACSVDAVVGVAVLGACSVDAVVDVAVLGACSVDAVVGSAVLGACSVDAVAVVTVPASVVEGVLASVEILSVTTVLDVVTVEVCCVRGVTVLDPSSSGVDSVVLEAVAGVTEGDSDCIGA